MACGGGPDIPDIWRLSKPHDATRWTIQLYPRRASDRLYAHSPLVVGRELEVVVQTRRVDDPSWSGPDRWDFGVIIAVERVS